MGISMDAVQEIETTGHPALAACAVPKLWAWSQREWNEVLGSKQIAIVGARSATDYGKRVATDFAHDLVRLGVTVVSGGAYGIDTAAHRGSLSRDMRAACVLPCGVDLSYPAGNSELFRQILEQGGCLISPFPPGTLPGHERFLIHNQVIAALSDGLVVVEAGLRSGTLNAARHASRLKRPVLGVPGPITSRLSDLPNQLIRSGLAPAVRSADDIMETVYPEG